MDAKYTADSQNGQGSDSNPAKRRRAKGETGEGNYICGCGKIYLSYPALYTHIKTKHDGVTPPGTTQPQTSSKSGRGRPKVWFIFFLSNKFLFQFLLIYKKF